MRNRTGMRCLLTMLIVALASCRRSSEKPPGQVLFERNCSVCHGLNGDGKGEAAYLLQPKPRNFRAGKFRLVTTQNLVPSREDVFRTLTNGMPGTPMPSWAQLPEADRRALADYVLKLNRDGWYDIGIESGKSKVEAAKYADEMSKPDSPIDVPEEPPVTASGLEEGRKYYGIACAQCHGENGEGKHDPKWKTAEGYPTWSRNLREGVFKGGRDAKQLYITFSTGLPGTPMPAQSFTPEQTWRVVQYVQSLSDPEAQRLAEVRSHEITARPVQKLPSAVDDAQWNEAEEARVTLMPLWWHEGYVDSVRVRALHDGERLALRLEWKDGTRDVGGVRQNRFPDGAAVELSAETSPPLFAMGAAGQPVSIWAWKALWDEDRKQFQDVESAYPRIVDDGYYGRGKGWDAEPLADPEYRPAAELGNRIAATERPSTVESARAAGLGTLTTRPADQQSVQDVSRWENGTWRLELIRSLSGSDSADVSLAAGTEVSVAFAIWDGSAGDRNGQKTVSIWNRLILQ